MTRPRNPKPEGTIAANDNERQRRSHRLPKAEVRLPKAMPVQLVEVEVLAELLESLPAIANDNGEESE
ncbi:MAG TPA: hypothetical protein VKR31_08290 [Rhizomicrobium sp.]|nr:hypothetical protein [Rhizomicrobium sp.]